MRDLKLCSRRKEERGNHLHLCKYEHIGLGFLIRLIQGRDEELTQQIRYSIRIIVLRSQ